MEIEKENKKSWGILIGMDYNLAREIGPELTRRWEAFVTGQKTGSLFQMPFWKDLFDFRTHRQLFFGEKKRIRFKSWP